MLPEPQRRGQTPSASGDGGRTGSGILEPQVQPSMHGEGAWAGRGPCHHHVGYCRVQMTHFNMARL